jgi:DNA polymerase
MTRATDIATHLRYFAELGVTGISRDAGWRERALLTAPAGGEHRAELSTAASDAPGVTVDPVPGPPEAGVPLESLASIRDDLGDCIRCVLHAQGRRQIVFGVGNPQADLMFVGEAPGADEDIQGEPFVGRAGQLLTKIIESIGLERSDVYIANVIKCRPPGNRNPAPEEVATCQPFLFRQIDAIGPRVIVALGTFAAHALLGTDAPISRLRGRAHRFRGGITLIPTFHPAFLLRSPERKRDVWEDMKQVRALLAADD